MILVIEQRERWSATLLAQAEPEHSDERALIRMGWLLPANSSPLSSPRTIPGGRDAPTTPAGSLSEPSPPRPACAG